MSIFSVDMTKASFLSKAKYKSEFIAKFGSERWKAVHEGTPKTIVDQDGKKRVVLVIPDLPDDVFKWIKGNGWTLQLYIQSTVGETNDIGSNIEYNTAQIGATVSNVATEAGRTVKRLVIIAGAVGVAWLFREQLFQALKGIGKK